MQLRVYSDLGHIELCQALRRAADLQPSSRATICVVCSVELSLRTLHVCAVRWLLTYAHLDCTLCVRHWGCWQP